MLHFRGSLWLQWNEWSNHHRRARIFCRKRSLLGGLRRKPVFCKDIFYTFYDTMGDLLSSQNTTTHLLSELWAPCSNLRIMTTLFKNDWGCSTGCLICCWPRIAQQNFALGFNLWWPLESQQLFAKSFVKGPNFLHVLNIKGMKPFSNSLCVEGAHVNVKHISTTHID